nr:MAG TPA: hypothetical protein [Inoviridae sp.]
MCKIFGFSICFNIFTYDFIIQNIFLLLLRI